MAVSCGGSVIKILLFIFNGIWVLCGAAIIYLGVRVVLIYNNNDISQIIHETPNHSAVVLIAAGGLILVFSFLGCCGAIKESTCMLNTYGGLILICLAAQGVGAYLAIRYNYDLEQYANDGIKSALHSYDWSKPSTDPANRAINEFQRELQCCGAKSRNDWKLPEPDSASQVIYYPGSCCKDKSAITPDNKCPITSTWEKGCTQAMLDYMTMYIGSLGYVAIGIVLIELLILVSACCLVRDIKSRYADYGSPGGKPRGA
ncbi:23 kDa integral membrane protein-like [Oppia nitens]|uniref:23 kDa integral membrane protein-like n=1 Tax=Oppia nitens TaxID=1686743 RepID=UPI0023DA985B|nr:23 kDa integral membrane protein-like [Oppia nitens]